MTVEDTRDRDERSPREAFKKNQNIFFAWPGGFAINTHTRVPLPMPSIPQFHEEAYGGGRHSIIIPNESAFYSITVQSAGSIAIILCDHCL